jgi:glutamate---cysteine ligase / carboxylate-amine ligase
METRFGASAPYTIGVEEEYQLIDPATLELSPVIGDVLAARDAAGLPSDLVASELSASCIEVRSPVYRDVAGLAGELPKLRRQVKGLVEGCGALLAAAGAHPFSDATAQPITAGERYRRVEEEMGWAARTQAIYGLHVHVAVPDEEAAIRATNTLARNVPLFIALSGNSPFWRGRDTRLSSVRAKVFGLVLRSGLPPAFRSWEEFEHHVDILVRAGSIPDYTWCWWDARPHPRIGTVELRAPDVQTEAGRAVALAALTQCLVATAGDHRPEDPLFTEENKWRATRYGLDARLHDFSTGESTPARDAARRLVEELRPVSQDLRCEDELESLLEIVAGSTGAERQRQVFAKSGSTKAVVEYLVGTT